MGMLEAGVLEPRDWGNTPTESMDNAINRLFRENKFDFHKSFGLEISDDVEKTIHAGHNFDYSRTVDRNRRQGQRWNEDTVIGGLLICGCNEPHLFTVGRELERLEKLWPRLGQTILDTIARSSWPLMGCITPIQVEYLAQHNYWMGEDDHLLVESEEYDQQLSYLKEKEPDKAKNFTKSDVDMFRKQDLYQGGVPEWAYRPRGFSVDRPRYPKIPRKDQPKVEELLHLAKSLRKYKLGNDKVAMEEPSEFNVGYWIRWSRKDCAPRVVDDGYESEANCGEAHDITWARLFRSHDPHDIKDAFVDLRKMVCANRLLDRMIRLIGRQL
jgi:PRTRC genetic system protein F